MEMIGYKEYVPNDLMLWVKRAEISEAFDIARVCPDSISAASYYEKAYVQMCIHVRI